MMTFKIIVTAISMASGQPVWVTEFARPIGGHEECATDGSELVKELDAMFAARGVPVEHVFECREQPSKS